MAVHNTTNAHCSSPPDPLHTRPPAHVQRQGKPMPTAAACKGDTHPAKCTTESPLSRMHADVQLHTHLFLLSSFALFLGCCPVAAPSLPAGTRTMGVCHQAKRKRLLCLLLASPCASVPAMLLVHCCEPCTTHPHGLLRLIHNFTLQTAL